MELTLDQALQKGIEAHKAGRVKEADLYYTTVLKADPKHSDANHNKGVLAVGLGKVKEALPFFEAALNENSNVAQFWLSYINALIELGRIDDARLIFDKAQNCGFESCHFDELEAKFSGLNINVNNNLNSDKAQANILNELKLEQAIRLAKK